MTAARDEIVAFLDAELETHRYRDYAPIGLQVIGAERVERVATAVSSTLERVCTSPPDGSGRGRQDLR